jgi:hypothetical protein
MTLSITTHYKKVLPLPTFTTSSSASEREQASGRASMAMILRKQVWCIVVSVGSAVQCTRIFSQRPEAIPPREYEAWQRQRRREEREKQHGNRTALHLWLAHHERARDVLLFLTTHDASICAQVCRAWRAELMGDGALAKDARAQIKRNTEWQYSWWPVYPPEPVYHRVIVAQKLGYSCQVAWYFKHPCNSFLRFERGREQRVWGHYELCAYREAVRAYGGKDAWKLLHK